MFSDGAWSGEEANVLMHAGGLSIQRYVEICMSRVYF